MRAQRRMAYLIKSGQVKRPGYCEECGNECRAEAAHYDYSEPERVRWLCRSCHVKWDKAEPKGGVTRWQNLTGKHATLDGDGRMFAEIKAERCETVAA